MTTDAPETETKQFKKPAKPKTVTVKVIQAKVGRLVCQLEDGRIFYVPVAEDFEAPDEVTLTFKSLADGVPIEPKLAE